MAELPEEKRRKAFEAIEGFLHRMAMQVLEAPRSEREAVYEIVRESLSETRRELNLADTEMADFEENFMSWLRALVSIIERSGGGQGGTA